ncbi:hypothetical protein M430DRAFT_37522 [Amorphotheca resinae ATCC 22711]|jgi:hypothetical protein|uniref:F-box domain-containing protein n=1 Tax=Amorphotheca resinae ATCC 22711 TaxID=857342 RepID=A0A2T3AR99_AMORE|nr:hypothetical protein M430DRAFT_37522 [Amorphotheca resinae ATCC 22711]PSS08776.1 hypothetical protein M430DRAFT_37522 [Amorphotheca resinae ATCC 22711]
MPPQAFRFLDLPPEIRQKIYTLICTSDSLCVPLDEPDAHSSYPSNLLLTNSQLYHEVRPFYFTVNAFSVTVRRQNEDWAYFLSPSFLDNRRQVRSLEITLLRWGSKNFFHETLIPVLEDCILNGRLRCLEIRVSDKWFRSQIGQRNTGNYQGDTLSTLKRILLDPYLEKAVLKAGVISDTESNDYDEKPTLTDVTLKLLEPHLKEAGERRYF